MGRPTVSGREFLFSGERNRAFPGRSPLSFIRRMDYKIHPKLRGRLSMASRHQRRPSERNPACSQGRSLKASPMKVLRKYRKPPTPQEARSGSISRSRTTTLTWSNRRCRPQLSGDPARRPGAEVLFLPAPRHPPHRDPQGGHRGGRQPLPGQGRQEQGRGAVSSGRVRHRVRRRHLQAGQPDRSRARARPGPEVGLVLFLRGAAARPGSQQRQAVPDRERRDRK